MTEVVDVLVVGSGPAGLGAAIGMRGQGVAKVVVVERDAAAGGVPRHCAHPPFGVREFARVMTGPEYAARLVDRAIKAGVDIRTQHTATALAPDRIVDLSSPAGCSQIVARRIVLATGMRETPRAARLVSGERPQGIMNTGALQALVNLKGISPFRRPVVVGTELVGLSALATCRKHGIDPVAIVETSEHSGSPWPFSLFPKLLRIRTYFGAQIVDIVGRARVESVRLLLKDRSFKEIACDGLLFTGQFVAEATLAKLSGLEIDGASGGPVVDNYGRSSDANIYAIGNMTHPAETAGWCYREGEKIGHIVAADLRGEAPPGSTAFSLRAGGGVMFMAPERIYFGESRIGLRHLHVWMRAEGRGALRVTSGEQVLWSRRIRGRPARRYDIPLAALQRASDLSNITIDQG